MSQITQDFAEEFTRDWIAAWNAHHLDRILSHYAEDFEMSSPLIARIGGEASGTIRGKQAVREYWAKGLAMMPDLRFEWIASFVGVDSLAIHFKGAGGRPVVEVLHFDADGKVGRAFAHYA
jgi:hypothetical protein